MAWGKNGTPDTSTGTVDVLTISDMTANNFGVILSHVINTGTISANFTADNITTSTYAWRVNRNGGASDDLGASQTSWATGGDAADSFHVYYFCNISGQEKLMLGNKVDGSTAGAGTAPERREQYGKSTQTAQFTRIDNTNVGAGSYLIDSNLSALGSDLTPSAAVPFAENAQVGSRAEITDTRKMYHFVAGNTPTYETDFTTNTGWVEADSGKIGVDTSTERLDFNILRDGSNDKAYYDLGSALSDTAWVMRFKCTMTAQNYTSSSNKIGSFGMSSVTGSATTTQDFLGLYKASNGDNASVVVDGSILGPSTGSSLGRPAAGTIRYHEMKRTSATSWTNSIYSTSDYSGTPDATHTLTIASSIIGLRYFNITNWIGTGGVGNVAGYIDDVTIYDGVTSVQVGNAWSEEGT